MVPQCPTATSQPFITFAALVGLWLSVARLLEMLPIAQ